jgi:carboxyl-terminal processing protease
MSAAGTQLVCFEKYQGFALGKKKYSHVFSQLPAALFVLLLVIPGFVFAQQKPQGSSSAGSNASGKPAAGGPSAPRRNGRARGVSPIEEDFQEALRLVEDHYVEGSKLDYNAVFKSSITGMLRSLDPHSNYFDKEEFDELKTDQRSEYFGIGASIQNYIIGDDADTFITATFENSPAARGGLRFGDRIVAVDGVKMTGKQSIEVRDKIRGPRGSLVKITVERAADGRIETIPITRQAVAQPSIPDAYLIRPGVGYVDMSRGFNYTTTEELQGALDELHARGMTSLVLDLRNNPGGFLDQAIQVAETFLPNGELILTQKGRNGFRDNTRVSRNAAPDLTPLVILINDYTASASEIVAGAMQDHDRALIVGKTSFGKGLVQSIIPLEHGAGLTLTSAKYYTPSGRLIQRDYSNGGFYDYYTHGGSTRLDPKGQAAKPSGPEKRTDTGRAVYGGGGIEPDESIQPRTVSLYQQRLVNPIFAFSRELVNQRISGFEAYKVQKPIDFHHALEPTDFPITDAVFYAFKEYLAGQPALKMTTAQLDHNRAFIATQLRFHLVAAAFGRVMADRVFVATDPQVAKAVDVLPRARDLAKTAAHGRGQQ